jgi:hypothetical protein
MMRDGTLFLVRNYDRRFLDVKVFACRDDIVRGVHMASLPNHAVPVALVTRPTNNPEEYVEVHIRDVSRVVWAPGADGRSQDGARAVVERNNNIVLLKRKHIECMDRESSVVLGQSVSVIIRNSEARFDHVKCYATFEDTTRGIFKDGIANGTPAEVTRELPADMDAFVEIYTRDSAGGAASSWVKRKHLEPSASAQVAAEPSAQFERPVSVVNADLRFADVKCFASLDDARRGVYMASAPNGTIMDFLHAESGDGDYALLRFADSSLTYAGRDVAAQTLAREMLERNGKRVWLRRKHVQELGCRSEPCDFDRPRATARCRDEAQPLSHPHFAAVY